MYTFCKGVNLIGGMMSTNIIENSINSIKIFNHSLIYFCWIRLHPLCFVFNGRYVSTPFSMINLYSCQHKIP